MTAPQLENLGTLVKFLADNQITLDGQRVAYPADANIQDPRYQLFKLEGAAGTLELARNNEAVKYGYRVDKNLLSKYLDSLRGQLAKEPNPVLNVLVQARIQDVNDQLDAGMGAEYKQPERTLVPTKIVDSLPANVKTQYPYEKGSLPLTYADITSDTAFNAWIQKNNIYVDDKQHDFPQYNKAGLLTVLSKRAEYDQGNASTQDAKDTATIYGVQVAKLAQMFHVTLSGGAKTTAPAAGTGTGAGAPGAAQVAALLQGLAETLPLQRDQLDFGRIRQFVNNYSSLATSGGESHQVQQVSTAMQQLEQYMTAATENTVGQSQTTFSMDGLTADDFVTWAIPPSTGQPTRSRGSAMALADYLDRVVRTTYTIVKDMYNSYYPQLVDNPRLLQLVEQQVGGHSIPFGSSVAANNISNIASARASLPQVGA